MAQLVESIEGMAEACAFFETPMTGGNVSLYNETLGEAIFPTPVVGIVGLLKPRIPVASPSAIGRALILLGGLGGSRRHAFRRHPIREVRHPNQFVGASTEARHGFGEAGSERHSHDGRRRSGESAHDLGDGGLAVALAECSFG